MKTSGLTPKIDSEPSWPLPSPARRGDFTHHQGSLGDAESAAAVLLRIATPRYPAFATAAKKSWETLRADHDRASTRREVCA